MVSNETSTVTKKQHVVPKFYLKNFANSSGSLEIFDKGLKKFTLPKHPSGIGYELFFYSQTTGEQDDIGQAVEKMLGSFENYISDRYKGICTKILGNEPLSNEDVHTIALHASILWLRGYGMRSQMSDAFGSLAKRMTQFWVYHPNIKDHVRKAIKEKGNPDPSDEEVADIIEYMSKGDYSIIGDNLSHLSMLEEYQGFANLLTAKKLRIFIANSDLEFITSDIPVNELLPKYAANESFMGWSFMERLHILPFSSKILIEFHDPDVLRGKRVIRKRVGNDVVAAANARQFAGSRSWCCGSSKENFYIRQALRKIDLPIANNTGKFNENFLGFKVS